MIFIVSISFGSHRALASSWAVSQGGRADRSFLGGTGLLASLELQDLTAVHKVWLVHETVLELTERGRFLWG